MAELQDAQQLDLQRHGHGFDFIEEQRSARRMLDFSDAESLRSRKGALLVAEKLAFKHRFGNSTTVDRDERTIPQRRAFVQSARDQFLT